MSLMDPVPIGVVWMVLIAGFFLGVTMGSLAQREVDRMSHLITTRRRAKASTRVGAFAIGETRRTRPRKIAA